MSETRAVYCARGGPDAPEALPSHGSRSAKPQKGGNRPVQLDLLDGRRKRRNPAIRTSEHVEQVTLMRWAALQERRYPELRLLHAVPNGGARHKAVAAAMRAEGVRRGVPDLDLPVARGQWHGLRIELKAKGGRLTPEQTQWLADLTAEGYRAEVCTGWESARELILEYLHT
jgi:hypothetical protein